MSSRNVAVLDYGAGNLRSAVRALERVGAEVTVTADPKRAVEADGLLVPGVGAFAACMKTRPAASGTSRASASAAFGPCKASRP